MVAFNQQRQKGTLGIRSDLMEHTHHSGIRGHVALPAQKWKNRRQIGRGHIESIGSPA